MLAVVTDSSGNTATQDVDVALSGVSSSLQPLAAQTGLEIGASTNADFFLPSALHRGTLEQVFTMTAPANALIFARAQPTQGIYDFANADTIIDFAEARSMKLHGHTLVWHALLPEWLTSQSWTKPNLEALLQSHISTVVGRYANRIHCWNVVNEPFEWSGPNFLSDSFWHAIIGEEHIDLAFQWAAAADPNALLFLNDINIFRTPEKLSAVYNLVEGMLNRGIPIHGIGEQLHLHYWGHPWEDLNEIVNLADLRSMIQSFASLGLEVRITEMDMRIQTPADPAHLQMQADVFEGVFQVCADEPNCTALMTWGVSDADSWIPYAHPGWGAGLLLDENYAAKPAYDALQGLM
jgi:endo-1,4-beta-xylanase